MIDLPHTSRLFKTLIQGGHYDRAASGISSAPSFSPGDFAKQFMTAAGEDNLVKMAKGNGTFVVAELVERIRIEGDGGEKTELSKWLSKKVRTEIEESKGKGSDVLLGRLKALDSDQ